MTVSVPATTSNLGPGFDCLGLALDLRNELTLELHEDRGPAAVEISGEGAAALPRDQKNMLVKAARLILPSNLPGRLLFKSVNRIPLARGLGSSAAAAVAGLWAGAHLFGTLRRSEDELEALAVALEGHPDNVAPCVHGGLTASLTENGRSRANRLNIHPSLSSVVCIPAFELATKKARAALPKKVPLADAVYNSSRAILLARALETGRTGHLADLMDDRLHQPYRAKLVPGLREALAAAVKAGAAGAALSGSGPTLFAFVEGDRAPKVGSAMKRAFLKKRIASRWLALDVDHQGVRIER
ncbi:MAG: homoserine kinase [Elusimicrobia bacterium]|nr:homoserine kinase [Elusimicrobiota bacterium]MDE2509974.1 homoserine kinase [Elusimicrobiota bacterium]